MITNSQASILQHTRDRAAGGFYCGDSPEMQSLVKLGFMQDAGRKRFVPDPYFSLTRAGREALVEWEKAQPKPVERRPLSSHYRDYLRSAHCDAGDSFARFLGINKPHYDFQYSKVRMVRRADRHKPGHPCEVAGEWCVTMKEAKASYKLALQKHRAFMRALVS